MMKFKDDELIELWKQGLSDRQLAKIFKCSHKAIQSRRYKLELEAWRPNFEGNKLKKEELYKTYKDKQSWAKDNNKNTEYGRNYRKKYPEKYKTLMKYKNGLRVGRSDKRTSQGLCRACNNKARDGSRICQYHSDVYRKKYLKTKMKNKLLLKINKYYPNPFQPLKDKLNKISEVTM